MEATERQQLLAELKEALGLEHTPVGLAFVMEPPPGIARPGREVPSGCSFWPMAEREVFYTSPEDHVNCPIGMMTMGFPIPTEREPEAKGLLDMMCQMEYISPEELPHIPSVQLEHRGIVYGPLAQFPVEPDVALFICRPGEAMLLAEATGNVDWTGGPALPTFGRPACGVIPMAMQSARSGMSLGCIGSRTYTSMSADEVVVAVPGTQLDRLMERLPTILRANVGLEKVHKEKRALYSS